MAITLQEAMNMSLEQIFAIVKGADAAASTEMQRLMTVRVPTKGPDGKVDGTGYTHAPLAERISQLMLERNQAVALREEELENKAATIEPTTEEMAAQAEEMASQSAESVAPVEPVVAEPVAPKPAETPKPAAVDHTVEDASWKAAGVTIFRDSTGAVNRVVVDYQVTEEDGTVVGRSTHFEGRNVLDAFVKTQNAHVLAARAFSRVKKQNLTFKENPRTVLTDVQVDELSKAAFAEKDEKKMQSAIRSLVETKFKEVDAEQQKRASQLIMAGINIEFMRRHLYDFLPCEANDNVLREYFKENRLEYTLDNLEHAFLDLDEQGRILKPAARPASKTLAEPTPNSATTATVTPTPESQPAAANPATESATPTPATVETPAAPAPAQTPASTPVTEATASTPAAAQSATQPARRPGVNSSLPPGTMRAPVPKAEDPVVTRRKFMQKVKEMSAEKMRHKINTDPEFVKMCRAYGIRV